MTLGDHLEPSPALCMVRTSSNDDLRLDAEVKTQCSPHTDTQTALREE